MSLRIRQVVSFLKNWIRLGGHELLSSFLKERGRERERSTNTMSGNELTTLLLILHYIVDRELKNPEIY